MKATGILRRVDDLGRIVIPKEVRHELDIKDGQTLEFFTDKDQLVILQKSDVQDGDKLPCISPGLSAETPLGTIVAKPCTDKENPGLWIELYRPESKVGMALALVEYSGEDKELVTRVWGNAQSEDYTDKVPHNYVEEYFAEDKDRLVQQDNPGLLGKGPGQKHPLKLPAGHLIDIMLRHLDDPQFVHQLSGPLIDLPAPLPAFSLRRLKRRQYYVIINT